MSPCQPYIYNLVGYRAGTRGLFGLHIHSIRAEAGK